MGKRMFFFIYTLQVRRLIGLFTILGGTPVHESDNDCLSGSITDVETDKITRNSIPPFELTVIRVGFNPIICHIHLKCLPFIGLLYIEECLNSSSWSLSSWFNPEELTTEISGRFILEDENCTRRLFLQRSKMNPRAPPVVSKVYSDGLSGLLCVNLRLLTVVVGVMYSVSG